MSSTPLLSDLRLPAGLAPTPALPPAPAPDPTAIPANAVVVPVAVPSAFDRHLLSRFSWGITPALIEESAAAGGARAWFDRQLDPAALPAAPPARLVEWWPHLQWSPAEKFAADQAGVHLGYDQDNDFCRWTLMRRMNSAQQVQEVMTGVWGNLLYVSLVRKSFPHLPGYDATIRANALGTYERLLVATVLHPCMLCYLDNAKSTQKAPNENLGRELLELHTVGRSAGYTEADVKDSTRILTGYRVDVGASCKAWYGPEDHAVGQVNVLDFHHANASPDGREVTLEYLSYLARHEATAQRVARALAVRFVADAPRTELVDAVATAYLDSGTDIPTTLRALVDHDDFAASADRKVRTPIEDFVNTYRTMQVKISPPSADPSGAATSILAGCTSMGQRPLGWPRPDGFPDIGDAWSSASRMLSSWRVHKNLAGAYYPKVGIEYKPWEYWLGPLPVRFDDLVDRLCRLLLAKTRTPRLLATAVAAIDVQPAEIVNSSHRAVQRMPLLLDALLDTPDHMTR